MSEPSGALPHYRALPRSAVYRPTRAHAMALYGENPVMRGKAVMRPPSAHVTVLRHCRCIDFREFSRDAGGECFCRDSIGGTVIVWATGERFCEPAPGREKRGPCRAGGDPATGPHQPSWPGETSLATAIVPHLRAVWAQQTALPSCPWLARLAQVRTSPSRPSNPPADAAERTEEASS